MVVAVERKKVAKINVKMRKKHTTLRTVSAPPTRPLIDRCSRSFHALRIDVRISFIAFPSFTPNRDRMSATRRTWRSPAPAPAHTVIHDAHPELLRLRCVERNTLALNLRQELPPMCERIAEAIDVSSLEVPTVIGNAAIWRRNPSAVVNSPR